MGGYAGNNGGDGVWVRQVRFPRSKKRRKWLADEV